MKKVFFLLTLSIFVISCNEERGVVTELKACDSSKDKDCSSIGNLENDVIMHVEERFVSHSATAKKLKCDKGYILINDAQAPFCVSKDENSHENHLKVRMNSIQSAEGFCNSQGKVLINHKQWMKIAQLIEEHSLNYGLGKNPEFLNSRELFVSKNNSIINFVTGQAEWVAWSNESLNLPKDCDFKASKASEKSCKGQFFGTQKLPGNIYKSVKFKSEPIAMIRSGSLVKHKKALYHAYIGNTPSENKYGVRCVYQP